jgi:hypothetical protein
LVWMDFESMAPKRSRLSSHLRWLSCSQSIMNGASASWLPPPPPPPPPA